MNNRNPLYAQPNRALPPDLMPRQFRAGKAGSSKYSGPTVSRPASKDPRMKTFEEILLNTEINVATNIIERGIIGRIISIGSTPVQIIDGKFQRGYIILNPSSGSFGALTAGSTTRVSSLEIAGASGNTQGSPVGVGNYRSMVMFLDITASTGGTVSIDIQSQDPVSLNWATTQSDIFASPSAVGTYYADLGALGIDNSLAIAFTIGAGGNSTFSVGHILKDGLAGTASGIEKTVYLGGADVTVLTGLPLLEGQKERLWARPNSTLHAVSQVPGGVELSVFELQ